jgi:hypothetical protein
VHTDASVNKRFKSTMRATGQLCGADEKLQEFPAIASALLKYKKHEWVIIAFEKDKQIRYLWINKGFDNQSASVSIGLEAMAGFPANGRFSSVLMFHNHPNSNPRFYSCSKASPADLQATEAFSRLLETKGINHIAFVCERGDFFKYFENYSRAFFPLKSYVRIISNIDRTVPGNNYRLHKELRRTRVKEFI